LGLFAAFAYDFPAGPSIVLAATGIFLGCSLVSRLMKLRAA
jgi:ABC-type Mn2+/Zn2+ transport system permease subunit